ncbi:MAG TPA: ribonuclease HI family protein [Candidatus Brocadiia bacterium]|nr:ribonuclease HI family protein [Planctomycetota bacterium]MDO8094656.1 ribonuclease HI family protein [Candidatus Brocadiales bacterium]
MPELSDYELLQLIYKNINLDALKSQNNSVTRERLDNLFSKLLNVGASGCSPLPSYEKLIIHADGASRGNPGKAGIGIVILNKDGQEVEEISEYIGETTNNVAEYKAIITAARKALEFGAKDVVFKLDSELVVKQIHHKYSVKASHIIPLYRELQGMLRKFQKWEVIHVPREENFRADSLANMGIDSTLE